MEMKYWYCRKCEQEVSAVEKPDPIRWDDGHVCHFVEDKRVEEYNGEWPPGAPKYR